MRSFKLKISIVALFMSLIAIGGTIHAQQKASPVFKDGEAQIVPAFNNPNDWIRHDLWVETTFDTDADGKNDLMHVSVTRPAQTETEGLKLPVIYISSPYFAGTAPGSQEYFWNVQHELGATPPKRTHAPEVVRRGKRPIISNSHIKTWVPRGYIVVHSSSPGTGLSQGAPTVGGINESLAPKAVIEWLTGNNTAYTFTDRIERVEAYWSTGKVGMTGTSYNGTIPLAAATTGVAGLEAIIPIAPNTSYYHYYRSHGLVRSPGGYLGEDADVLYEFIHSGEESKRASNNARIRDTEMAQGMDRETGDYNDFWKIRDYLNAMSSMKAALLMSHGFNDWNVMPEHSYRIYKRAKEMGLPTQLFYHQGGHGGPPPMKIMNRWFTRYLHGIENGVENDAPVWIVRENDERSKPTPYKDYPHPESQAISIYLEKGAPEKGKLHARPLANQGLEKIIDNYSFSGKTLANAENTEHRLLFVSPVLKKDLHISGISSLKIKASSSKPAVNLSVWLVSLPWNNNLRAKITDNIITRGWADLQNYKSLRNGEPLIPGKFYEMEFTLQPEDQIIPAGQQIGLLIFSSDREFTLWPEPGTELTVDLDGTQLKLPIVGGLEAWKSAISN